MSENIKPCANQACGMYDEEYASGCYAEGICDMDIITCRKYIALVVVGEVEAND